MELLFRPQEEGDHPPGPGVCRLWILDEGGSQQRAFAETILKQGPEALARWSSSCQTLIVSAEPTLDDMLAAHFVQELQAGRGLPPHAARLAQYAALARRGHVPGDVAPEQSLAALYAAICTLHGEILADSPAAAVEFLSRWRALARDVLQSEYDPFSQPAAGDDPIFAEEREFLRNDRAVYGEDVRQRGRRYRMTFPGEAGESAALYLDHPRSILFKLWTRGDADAPGGARYALLIVRFGDSDWRISTDPVQRRSLKDLAVRLQQAERQKLRAAAGDDPWFDGVPFNHTMIAAPRRGTRLSEEEVLKVVTFWARLRPARERTSAGSRGVGLSLALVVVAVCITWIVATQTAIGGKAKVAIVRGSVIDPATDPELNQLTSGGIHVPGYAVIVGVNKTGGRVLRASCNDAGAIYALLRDHYGFEESNMVLLVDTPEDALNMNASVEGAISPTRENLVRAVMKIGEMTKRYPAGNRSNFIFYYAGHGEPVRMKRQVGYLVLEDAWNRSLPASQRSVLLATHGMDMGMLSKLISDNISSSHQLLLIDCCFSGFTSQTRGYEPATEGQIYRAWGNVAHVVITAGTNSQQVNELPDHSFFARALLKALEPGLTGRPHSECDVSHDGIVTDEELAAFLAKEVPKMVAKITNSEPQDPQRFTDLRDTDHDWGQFIFIPTRHPTIASE